ncbi:leucine zipper putative tumor suppressor 1 [Rhinatrema bivittatum]|uniref:leucine zipper putative tumor suppressor 1 n=1 Tax=Rhinatrema bivittatum TaxID=194408 RepID=UPI00112EE334|nr:leucine zipper putative tumor suppressor 1 [Rhinatrema bivittatum]
MGSVSSLISGHNFNSKHGRSSQDKLRKSSHLKKLNRYSDGLLRFGFSQESSHGKSSCKMGKNEDFFYIKVSQKSRGGPQRPDYSSLSSADLGSQGVVSTEYASCTNPPKLMHFSNQLEPDAEKNVLRPTVFKPVQPRSSGTNLHSSPGNGSRSSQQAHSLEKPKVLESKSSGYSGGALSDSGRNSMSSLPTHSTTSSYQLDPLVTPMGHINRFGGSAHNITQCTVTHGSNMLSLKAMSISDGGNSNKIINVPGKAHHLSEKISCIRTPIATDETAVQELEKKLLEREEELQELQSSFEAKEMATCQVFEEKQRRCKEELDLLKQKCSTRLRQNSQKAQRSQQVLHLQIFQLQQDKKQLQEDLQTLLKERDLLESKLKSYEKEKTNFAPALEETQWEVCQKSGEISLLKQQLKDSQSELSLKTSEILSLKAQLKDVKGKIEVHEQHSRERENLLHTKDVDLEVCENELQRKKKESELLREKVKHLEQEVLELRAEVVQHKDQSSQEKKGSYSVESRNEALQKEVEELKCELEEERQNNEQMTTVFQNERQTWKEEKEKVIHYQKQLQQNYLHMYKKNQALEKSLHQLSPGDEEEGGSQEFNMDLDLADLEIPFEDIIATEI